MPLLKVQEPGESNAAIAAVSRGNRFANSIPRVFETDKFLLDHALRGVGVREGRYLSARLKSAILDALACAY